MKLGGIDGTNEKRQNSKYFISRSLGVRDIGQWILTLCGLPNRFEYFFLQLYWLYTDVNGIIGESMERSI